MKTILAVAIGKPSNNQVLTAAPSSTSLVRPYINGLISWLATQTDNPQPDPDNPLTKYNIGTDYKIDYRECDLGDLAGVFTTAGPTADLLFCMSTTVARAAAAFTTTKPIVAIVSDPFSETFGANVYGASAGRDRLVRHALRQFRRKNPQRLTKIYALHREGYTPSTKSKAWLGNNRVVLWPVLDSESIQVRIQAALDENPATAKIGFLILPADRFFGAAPDIVSWTGDKPTFWTTPDFPRNPAPGSFGGYGYPQAVCGQFLAERVAGIWTSEDAHDPSRLPDPKWVLIDPQNIAVRPGALGALATTLVAKPAAKKSSAKKPAAKKSSAKKPSAKKSPAKRRKK
jgi:hypothetical protein